MRTVVYSTTHTHSYRYIYTMKTQPPRGCHVIIAYSRDSDQYQFSSGLKTDKKGIRETRSDRAVGERYGGTIIH
jgi:hypothetical protein